MNKRTVLAVAAITALISLPSSVSAVEYGGIGGRPANPQPNNPRTESIFIYELQPGQQTSDGVKIYNNTDTSRTISVGSVDSILASGGAFSCAQASDKKTDVGSWIQLGAPSVDLAPGENQTVPFNVTAPQGASVGEHDGCITIQDASMTKPQSGKSGVVLGFRSAIRVVITIPGTIVKKLSLSSVTVSKSKGSYIVAPTAKNEGNVSLDTDVSVSWTSLFGTRGVASHGTYPVLPASTASWNFELKQPFWGGWYKAHAAISYNNSTTATLGQSGGVRQVASRDSGLFFAMPSPLAAFVEGVSVGAILALVLLLIKKQRNISSIRRHWQDYVVQEDDSITSLAKQHHVAWKKIARANKLKPPYALHKNQKLKLPKPRKE